jgi:hypothetical protein
VRVERRNSGERNVGGANSENVCVLDVFVASINLLF